MTPLIIRPVANGYYVKPHAVQSNCTTPDSEIHVFNTPEDLADFVKLAAQDHEKTRDADKNLRDALDA